MSKSTSVFLILALTQITGWGVVSFLPVLAPLIATDLRIPLPTAFLGTTILYATMGLVAPVVGKAFRHFGAKTAMVLGVALIGAGLVLLSITGSALAYLFSWVVLGVGGAMFLTTAAYVYLAEFVDKRARGMIGSLMLFTGLAGSVFWPLTAYLQHLIGWRTIAQTYATGMIVLILPLILVGLPDARSQPTPEEVKQGPARRDSTFWLLVTAIALNGFVTYGMEAIGIELFRALGADATWAVGMASFLGILKVCGRLIDVFGGKRWNAISTGIVAGAMIPAGLLVPLAFGASTAAVTACLLLFGIGSGAFAVARATMPLVFYQKSEYAAAMSMIALPINLTSALAAPILSGTLTISGSSATLVLLAICSGASLLVLLRLGRVRKVNSASAAP